MISKKDILKALSYVEDPDLKQDLVTLNMIQNLELNENTVSFDLVLTTPACPLKETIANACRTAIKTMVSDTLNVEMNITSKVQQSVANNQVLKGIKNIVAVGSGKGGVGKSTVVVNLARSLKASGASVGILDADIHGPSVPVLLNTQGKRPEMDGDLMIPVESEGIKTMSLGYLVAGSQAVVWRGPMLSKAISQFCSDVKWGELDYLVVDLPPGTGDVHLSIIQQVPLSGVVIVTTPEEVAVADTAKAIDMFSNPQLKQNILGVVENMAYFQPNEEKYFLFGKGGGKALSEKWSLDFLGEIPIKEEKTFDALKPDYDAIAGKLVQKLAIQAASKAQNS